MHQQFYLADFYIDCARNQIICAKGTEQEVVQQVAPKAIEVFAYLAQKQGDVISVDELLDKVWPGSVVSPNSLQRCIAQLRKALGDDSKQQKFIKTHAKRGYSLEAAITADTCELAELVETPSLRAAKQTNKSSITEQSDLEKSKFSNISAARNWRVYGLLFALIAVVFIYGVYQQKYSQNWQYNKLTPLSSHDNKETRPTFSPDDKFITFHRFDGMCANNIWAKNLATQEEYRLTKSLGFYGNHRFTNRGKKIVFMAKNNCTEDIKQKACWQLMMFDFQQALQSPQTPTIVATCSDGKLSSPIWLDNQAIAVIRTRNEQASVVKYMPNAPDAIDIYTPKDLQLYQLLQANESDHFAALAFDRSNQQRLVWLDKTGKVVSNHLLQLPNELSTLNAISPRFDSRGKQFVFSVGNTLYALSYEGKISKLSTLAFNHLFHLTPANNSSLMAASQGFVDTDIATFSLTRQDTNLPAIASELNQPALAYQSISRSTYNERSAKFQPEGQSIAFISNRDGSQQVWLLNALQKLTKLTHIKPFASVSDFSWSPHGDSVILAVDGRLHHIFLDKTLAEIDLPYPVLNVYQWTKTHQLLASVRIAGRQQVVKIDLKTKAITPLVTSNVLWAQLSQAGTLVYLDSKQQLWHQTISGAHPFKPLAGLITGSRFLLNQGNILGISAENVLWRYQMSSKKLDMIKTLNPQFTRLSDVKDQEFIGSQIVSSRKDIVLLSHTAP